MRLLELLELLSVVSRLSFDCLSMLTLSPGQLISEPRLDLAHLSLMSLLCLLNSRFILSKFVFQLTKFFSVLGIEVLKFLVEFLRCLSQTAFLPVVGLESLGKYCQPLLQQVELRAVERELAAWVDWGSN